MIEIGIPVYKARATLQKLLDSLMAQTCEDFCVCLSIDGDDIDYSDIYEPYAARGLQLRVINSEVNEGPGIAREKILNSTKCEYLMFVDADDLLLPRAIEVLYNKYKDDQYDIIRSSFVAEQDLQKDQILPQNIGTITWFNGKVYRVAYLREKNIHFHPLLRTDEDAYFNLVAWNCAEKRGELPEVTYIWRYNKNSITRADSKKDYFLKTYHNYFISQIDGLKEIYRIKGKVEPLLIGNTLLNLYDYYMRVRYYKADETFIDKYISTLSDYNWIQDFLNDGANWIEIIKKCKIGTVYEENVVVLFNETFSAWVKRLLK